MAYRRPRYGYNRVYNQATGRWTRGGQRSRTQYYQRFPRASRGIVPARNRGYLRTAGYYGRYNVGAPRAGMSVEKKFFDTIISGFYDTAAEVLTSVNLIPQGVTEATRVGRKCTVTDINIKGEVRWDSITWATLESSQVRLVLVLDKQANGANPAFADVFDTSTSTTVNAFRLLSNVDRFTVLKNWHIVPQNIASSTTDNWATIANTVVQAPTSRFKFSKKCKIPLEFSSTTGAITEIRSNNIVLFAVAVGQDDVYLSRITVRIRFTDM